MTDTSDATQEEKQKKIEQKHFLLSVLLFLTFDIFSNLSK